MCIRDRQEAVPKGEGGMVVILGSTLDIIEKIIDENSNNYKCYIANDNSNGQLVVSGKINDLDILIKYLKENCIFIPTPLNINNTSLTLVVVSSQENIDSFLDTTTFSSAAR